MGEKKVGPELSGEEMRRFTRRLLEEIRALEVLLAEGRIEEGIRRIGVEQEMFLIDGAFRPALKALDVLDEVDDPHFTTELAQFNLEVNLDPLVYGGDCLSRMHRQLDTLLEKGRKAARRVGADLLLTGILPTLRKSDLGLESMTPIPRYHALNKAMNALRGTAYDFRIKGMDELIVRHDSVMLEACNTSFQVHFQVGPREFAKLYNIAQTLAAPVLAIGTNSPLLFNRRLWRETRIALFQQAIDTRSQQETLRERVPRVSFGRTWVDDSVVEIYKEDVARFRVLLSTEAEEDPAAVLARGEVPQLKALCLHNGTVYRWNRACYGVHEGIAHLRIENRVLPSGPTPTDEIANAAFWFGLMGAFADRYDDIRTEMAFEDAHENFLNAARQGMGAHFFWLKHRDVPARQLIAEELLPMARDGLTRAGIDPADIELYMGVLEERVRTGRTGSQWLLDSIAGMGGQGTPSERAHALTAGLFRRQVEGRPVHEWEPAELVEAGGWKNNYLKVEQYMTTDLYTVHADDPVELVANLMQWENIRHVPVEDYQHRLVGIVTYRTLLRLMAEGRMGCAEASGIAVSDVMKEDPVTATPEMDTIEATALMRRYKVGCLPVVQNDRLVGIVTERDFMTIASQLLERKLRE